jgi:hypothetical protein
MRNRISLAELQEQWKVEQRQKSYRDAHKYDGLESCRKNVIKCGCFKKLKYCVSTKEN